MVYNLKILVTSLTNYSIAEVRCCLSEAFHCLQSLKMCFEENLDKERCHIVGKWLYKGRSVYLNFKKKKISNDHCRHWMTLKMWSFLEGDLKKTKQKKHKHHTHLFWQKAYINLVNIWKRTERKKDRKDFISKQSYHV